MTTEYYTASGWPATGSSGQSSRARSELLLVEAGFAKLPALTGNGNKAVVINSAGTALTVTTGTLALAGNFATVGAYALTLTLTGATGVTLPTTGTLATLAGAESLSNKTLVAPILGTPASGTLTNCTGLPVSTGISGLGTGVATFLATPSSANLAAAVTDETGSGALVFATSPTFATSVLGSATMAVFNTGSTTVNAFGAATTLNIGNSGGTNTIAGATTFSQATTSTLNGVNFNVSVSSGQNGIYQITDGTRTLRMAHAADDSLYIGTTTNHPFSFSYNGAPVGQVTSTGLNSMAIGATTPSTVAATTGTFSSDISVNGVAISSYSLYDGAVFRVGNGSGIGINRASATDNNYIYFGSGTNTTVQQDAYVGIDGTNTRLLLGTAAVNRLTLDSGNAIFTCNTLPATDNAWNVGSGSFRWATIYAATGTINTSDAREKTAVSPMTAAEVEASKQLAREIGIYKWLSAVAEKGEAARKHVGFTVQKAIQIMQANSLDPMAYGFICYDQWGDDFVEHPAIEAKDAVLGEDGKVIEPAVEAKAAWTEQTQKAGDRYSFRYDELTLFIARGIEARVARLEGRE